MTDVRQSIERISGCSVSVKRAGTGPPVLFLHGASGASRWLPFMDALAAHFDVIVPEHPGYGRSETPPWLDNLGDLAYFYLDFIEHMGLRGVHLLGASLGGWVAAEIAVRNQHSLCTLTLVAPAGIHVPGLAKGDVFLWTQQELAHNLYHDQRLAEITLMQPPPQEEADAQLKNRLTTAKLAWQPRFYNPHLAKWLHRIKVPTLIVWGANDKLIPAQYAAAFGGLIPNSRLRVLEQCGHLPHVEKMADFVSAVTHFIEGVPQ